MRVQSRPTPYAEGFLPVFSSAKTEEKIVAITVDDCFQAENLEQIVNKAIEVGAKLTIFPIGKNVLKKTSFLLDTMKTDVPRLVSRANEVTDNVSNLLEDFKPLPGQVTSLLNSMDSTVGRVDNLVTDFGTVTTGLQDFMNTTESTLQSADDLMNGMSKMWLLKGNVPRHDSVPFVVETLW
jgi:hypothetical protein